MEAGRDMTSKNTWVPRKIYLYTICLITLVMAIFATVNLVRAVTELLYPEPGPSVYQIPVPVRAPGTEQLQPLQLDEKQLEEQREIQRQWTIRRSVLSLAGSVTMLLIALPLYLYHWRRIDRDSEPGTASSRSEG